MPTELSPAIPIPDLVLHRFAQLLYRCFEELGTTKAALYLSRGSSEGLSLVSHYGWPRTTPPPESLEVTHPLLLRLQRTGRPLLTQPPERLAELEMFCPGPDHAHFLVTPLLHEGTWVGLLVQKDRMKQAPFLPGADLRGTEAILADILACAQDFGLLATRHTAPVPGPPEPSPRPLGEPPSMDTLSHLFPNLPLVLDHRHPPPPEPEVPREASSDPAVRRGVVLPEQRAFFSEIARMLFSFIPLGAAALWLDEGQERRPLLLYSHLPLSPDLKLQVAGHLTFEVRGLHQKDIRLLVQTDFPERPTMEGAFTTCLPVPLCEEGEHQDLLLLFRMEDRPFNAHETAFILHVTRLLDLHFQEARLHENYHRAFLSVSHRLLSNMETRHPAIRAHSVATARLARHLALRLDLPSAEVEAVSIAAILHDVGTLLLDPHLLAKDRLNVEEFSRIQTHPALASTFLEGFRFPFDVVRIIRHHHERWDGQGYPDGLHGELIPLGSRIIHLVEAYEVMSAGRPYKAPMGAAAIREEFLRESGHQFDPGLVPEFLRLIESRQA